MDNPRTVDEVIADNIIRIRKASTPRVSQKTLAEGMGAIDGRSTNRSRVSDLETGRDGTLRPASWQDVVTVALALGVRVAEIVLPVEGTEMVLARPTVEYRDEKSTIPISMGSVIVDRTGALEFFQGKYGSIREEISSMRAELHADRLEMQETLQRFSKTVIERSPSGATVEVAIPPLDDPEDI